MDVHWNDGCLWEPINSSLILKSNVNAMGGNVSDSPEKETSASKSPRKYGNDQVHTQSDLMAH